MKRLTFKKFNSLILSFSLTFYFFAPPVFSQMPGDADLFYGTQNNDESTRSTVNQSESASQSLTIGGIDSADKILKVTIPENK